MGEVSGFWLTWYYFGYSPVYGTVIALVQIAGGVLLVLPRTSLLAALVLLPYNRAFMAVFRPAGGVDTVRHFEISDDGDLRVWARWLDRSDLVMHGRYDPVAALIDIELEQPGDGRLRLRRVSGPLAP